MARGVELGRKDGREPYRSCTDYGDRVAGLHTTVQDADFVWRGQDVSQHEDLLVTGTLGHLVGRGVGEGHPDVLRLRAVDEMAEDPAAPAKALAVAAVSTVAAAPAGADARDETRSPGTTLVTAEPTASTVPTAS